jgi:hypothetical protein
MMTTILNFKKTQKNDIKDLKKDSKKGFKNNLKTI